MQAAVEAYFRVKGEAPIAVCHVVQLEDGKKPKSRVAVVAAPNFGKRQSGPIDDGDLDLTEAVLYVLAIAVDSTTVGRVSKDAISIKQALPVRELSKDSPGYTGTTDAQYDVGEGASDEEVSTGVKLSFESSIQRESITAAIKRARRALTDEGGADGDDDEGGKKGVAFGGPVSIAGGGAVSYGRTIKKKRDDTRSGVLQPDDELYLAREAKAMKIGLSNVKQFENELKSSLAVRDIEAINHVVATGETWAAQAEEINAVMTDVLKFEADVKLYAGELMTRKSVIEEIEAESTHRLRVKNNLERLIEEVEGLLSCFAVDAKTEDDLMQFSEVGENSELSKFFADSGKVAQLARATTVMKRVLENPPDLVAKYYDLDAVSDRATRFQALQLGLGVQASKWIESVAIVGANLLLQNQKRKSTHKLIVLLPPTDFINAVAPLKDLMAVLRTVDFRTHAKCVRNVAHQLRSVYTIELRRFFKELRAIIRRTGWRGSLSIGDAVNVAGAGRVRRLAAQGELTPVGILTPAKGGAHRDIEVESVNSEADPAKRDEMPAEFRFQEDSEAGVRLLHKAKYTPKSAYVRKREIAAGFASTGYVRPDLAWAAALKGTSDLVFVQRNFYMNALGVRSRLRAWQKKLLAARARGSTETDAEILEGLPEELRDDIDLPEDDDDIDFVPEEPLVAQGLALAKHDELNTALWETFTTNQETRLGAKTLVHVELVHTARVIASKCDGLCLLPCLAATEKLLNAFDDGDNKSSAMTHAMLRRLNAGEPTDITADEEEMRQAFLSKRSGFFSSMLVECHGVMAQQFRVYATEQLQAIDAVAKANTDSPALMAAFSVFPVMLARLETMLADYVDPPLGRVERFLRDVVQRLFEKLDEITIHQPADSRAARHFSVFKQYLHHAFFAAVVQTTLTQPRIKAMLNDFFNRSKSRRDHYEAIYITGIAFPDAFPKFSAFMSVADDARRMFEAVDDLSCHSALKEPKVQAMAKALPQELKKGAIEATKRLKNHFARAVPTADPSEDLFFRCALPVTFQHLRAYTLSRVESFESLVRDLGLLSKVDAIPSATDVTAFFAAAEAAV